MSTKTIIETRDLVKLYGDGAQVRALDGVDLSIQAGEFVSIMGPSGSGKSTLLNMIGALDRPTSGLVLIDGQDLSTIRDLDRFRARTVGFIFQMHNLIPTLTARENVEVPMRGQPIHARQRHERSAELLELVGLGGRMNHLPNQLSGGERQRVAVARSLANRPRLILADEPTGNLDTATGRDVMRLLRGLNTQGHTVVLITHDDEIAGAARRVVRLRDGRIISDETRGGGTARRGAGGGAAGRSPGHRGG